jgi:hypothetical protein
MPARNKASATTKDNTANLGFEADLVGTAVRDSAFPQRETTPQVLSKAKNNMVAFPGQLFYSTQIPICLWFNGKNNTLHSANNVRLFGCETELSLVV